MSDPQQLRALARLPAEQALSGLKTLLTPDTPLSLWRVAYKFAARAKNGMAAREAMEQILQRDPSDAKMWIRLAAAQREADDLPGFVLTLERWRAARREDQPPREQLALKALSTLGIQALAECADALVRHLTPEASRAAFRGLARRLAPTGFVHAIAAVSPETLPDGIADAVRIVRNEMPRGEDASNLPIEELEILIACVIGLAGRGEAAAAVAALSHVASAGGRLAGLPRLNELARAAAASGDPRFQMAALPLMQAAHHGALRAIASRAFETGRTDLGRAALMRAHDLIPGNSAVFQQAVAIQDASVRLDVVEAMLDAQRLRAGGDQASAREYGRNLMLSGRLEESRDVLADAVARAPGDNALRLDYAETCFWLDCFAESQAQAQIASASAAHAPQALVLSARIAIATADRARAGAELREAAARGARVPPGLAHQAHMCGGDFAAAFETYWTGRIADLIGQAFPGTALRREALDNAWEPGGILRGTTAVLGIHGLGDEIRFSGVIPEIDARCEDAVFMCDARLSNLLKRAYPGIRFQPWSAQGALPGAARELSLHLDEASLALARGAARVADLKYFLAKARPDKASFAGSRGRLSADPLKIGAWKAWLARQAPGRAVGLFWRSTLASYTARRKSSALADWIALFGGMDIRVIALQYDLTVQERALIGETSGKFLIPDGLDCKRDIEGLAALMSALHLVVALPGTTQHLAGALDLRTFTPAHAYDAGWRADPATGREWWAPSVEIISGKPEDGLRGGMARTRDRISKWLADGR